MSEIELLPFVLPSLISLLLLYYATKWLYKPSVNKNLPPSPPKLPILGNLHQVGSSAHQDLHLLTKKHGPIMLLHFGSVPMLIVSSADAAREIMKTHDLTFSSRPKFKVYGKLIYDSKDVAFSPYGEYWRQIKNILVLHVLSSKQVQSFHSVRKEETAAFVKKIGESSRPVNLSKMFVELTNNGISRSAFGRTFSESENGKKILVVMKELVELLGSINIGDFIPWLSWINRVNGFDKRVDKVAKSMDDFLEGVIQERLENATGLEKNEENFLDIMIGTYQEKTADVSIDDRDSIKALLLDAFVGGTDTVAASLEWAMSELLRHPTVMEKLQKEVRGIVKDKQDITNDDIEKMQYLKAVFKETLRLHPPFPLLIPRVASTDAKVNGYDISAGTVVMINAWAIGRDPESWDEPEKFEPDRFLNSSKDFKGFNYIPFGAGRRQCPGGTFAAATIEFVLANVVQKFDWKLPDDGQDLDMSETTGITVRRGVHLVAIATKNK